MQLTQDNLHELFSVVDTGQRYRIGQNKHQGFSFVNNNSKVLVVTVGDSWTWGEDIAPNASNEFRITNLYGFFVAQELHADWLNLGQSGSSNFWIADKVQELCSVLPALAYTKVYLICTYTEVGRAVHTLSTVDFVEFFKQHDISQLLEFCDSVVTKRILSTAVDSRLVIKIARNFVDHKDTGLHIVPEPWYRLLSNSPTTDYCQVVSPWAIQDIRSMIDSVPKAKHTDFLNMTLTLTEHALQRESLLRAITGLRNYHPNTQGHRVWADYLLQQL